LSSARRDTPAIANTETDLATRERLPRLLTVPEVAAGLRVSTKTVRRMVEKGEIQAVRIGRAIRISEADYVCRTRTG
jgi:excisionase family DNA binding protein